MLDHALLAIGAAMIASGITLASKDRSTVSVAAITTLGVICCLTQAPGLQSFVFKNGDVETTINMRDVKVGTIDLQAQIASSNQTIQSLSGALAKQSDFNAAIDARLRSLEKDAGAHAATASPPPDVTTVNPQVAKNRTYSVLIFYRDLRSDDAAAIKKALIDAGYQSASINSSLSEVTVPTQSPGTSTIVYSARGRSVVDDIEALIRQKLGAPQNALVTKGSQIDLRRGDAQVLLF